jgi:hypothetical protein
MAAILGYVFSHPLAQPFRISALWIVIIVTLLFIIAVGSVGWGLWTGVRDLESAQEMLSSDAFAKLRLYRFFARARVVFWIITTTTLLILVILLAARYSNSSKRISPSMFKIPIKKTVVGSYRRMRDCSAIIRIVIPIGKSLSVSFKL